MSGRRQADRLAELAGRLSDRDQAIVADMVRLRFVTSGQVMRLHFAAIEQAATRTRRTQRSLRCLVQLGLLLRLRRRVGGVRAGSASLTFAPTAEAIRLVSYMAGGGVPAARQVVEPGHSFVDHTVAVNELYVRLIEAARLGECELLDHQAEPDCWRRFLGSGGQTLSLRPDAFVAIGVAELEQRSFIEVDRDTQGASALRRKLACYVAYWRSGAEQQRHQVFPRVIWQAERPRRRQVIADLITELPEPAGRLFVVTGQDSTVEALRGQPAASGGDR